MTIIQSCRSATSQIGPGGLSASVLILGEGKACLALVTADLIWFPDEVAARIRARIAALAGVGIGSVILAASHTHGSPQLDPRFNVRGASGGYATEIENAIIDATARALAAPAVDITLLLGRAAMTPPISINRRRIAHYRDGLAIRRRVQNLPNFERGIAPQATVVVARDAATNAVRTLVVHAVCHPVTLPRDATGPDFPGVLRKRLGQHFGPDVPVLFLQGHCGDIRPRLIHRPTGLKDHIVEWIVGTRFRPSERGDTQWAGDLMADACERAIRDARPLPASTFAAAHDRLPLADVNGAPVGRDLDVTAWRLAPSLAIVASSGEMLSGLASPDPRVLSVGYANGMVGYLAPSAEYEGGGYEIDGFLPYFGLERRFSPRTEAEFLARRTGLLTSIGMSHGPGGASDDPPDVEPQAARINSLA